ncbi:S-formylglutathione hydrolase FrmB [Actinokineospora spheciospongiae]|nr:S-formylglutathione hydrolase FrmB [Actinokineospora spheciospongiae]
MPRTQRGDVSRPRRLRRSVIAGAAVVLTTVVSATLVQSPANAAWPWWPTKPTPTTTTAAPAATLPSGAPQVTADDGAKVVKETRIDERTLDLEIQSPALLKNGMVRVYLPTDWSATATRTWPQLWLLHGCCEDLDYKSWDSMTDAKAFTADKGVITVMPTDGPAGMYSEWWNLGLRKTANWEAFHMKEVLQIIERGYKGGTKRAVAGVSIGGYGALAYGFRFPGTFASVASYSGIPNTMFVGTAGVIKGILVREGFWNPADLWGDEMVTFWIWQAHNPYNNIEKFRGTNLYISSGNGEVGPLDPPGKGGDPLDASTLLTSRSFTDRLKQLGIPATVDYYGKGTHSWPYWERALHNSWPVLAKGLGI